MNMIAGVTDGVITQTFFPLDLLGEGWRWCHQKSNSVSIASKELNLSDIKFVDCLYIGEAAIICSHKIGRLRICNLTACGASIFYGILGAYRISKGKSMLDELYESRGIQHIDFPGDVFFKPGRADKVILVLYRRSDNVWDWSYKKFTAICTSDHVSAVISQPQI